MPPIPSELECGWPHIPPPPGHPWNVGCCVLRIHAETALLGDCVPRWELQARAGWAGWPGRGGGAAGGDLNRGSEQGGSGLRSPRCAPVPVATLSDTTSPCGRGSIYAAETGRCCRVCTNTLGGGGPGQELDAFTRLFGFTGRL